MELNLQYELPCVFIIEILYIFICALINIAFGRVKTPISPENLKTLNFSSRKRCLISNLKFECKVYKCSHMYTLSVENRQKLSVAKSLHE